MLAHQLDEQLELGPVDGSRHVIDQGAIVGAMTAGLHDDIALKPQVVPQTPQLGLRRVTGCVAALGGIGKLRSGSKHVTVSVHGPWWRYEPRPMGRGMKRQP